MSLLQGKEFLGAGDFFPAFPYIGRPNFVDTSIFIRRTIDEGYVVDPLPWASRCGSALLSAPTEQ
jgi:hypothetical protein